MDYEKKYKEALALAHSYYDKDSMNAFLDTIFPELRESWAELQSEFRNINKAFEDGKKEVIAHPEKYDLCEPAEIDEEHKVGKWFTGLIPCWIDAPSTLQPAHSYHGKNVIAIHEKSGGYRCCCIDDEKPITFSVAENTHLVEGWRNRKLPEWSEEDEDMLNSCISSIEEAKENRYAYKETDGDTSYDYEIEWLKSIRPSWKPNKEQMDRLFSIIAALRKDYCDNMADFLASLYKQLKAL